MWASISLRVRYFPDHREDVVDVREGEEL